METPENKAFVYEFGKFVLDPNEKTLFVDGLPVHLPAKEFETLLLLVEHNGQALAKEEMMSVIWQDAFVEESNLAKQISRLRKVLNTNGDEYIETLPKHGYRFSAELHRVIPSPDDSIVVEKRTIKRVTLAVENETASAPLALAPPARSFFTPSRIAGVAVAGLIGIAAIWFWNQARQPAPATINTIAVLPLRSLSDDEASQALGLGLADALITRLSNAHQLIVRPTSAVRKFATKEQDISTAGRELNVGAVLEGSIQRSGDKVRVTVQLVRVADGAPLWAGNFDERFTDIFAVQDSISTQVAQVLQLKLTREEQRGLTGRYTESPEAYQAYLMGRYFWNKRTTDGFRKAIGYFEQAIEKDKNFALAYVGIADSYILIGYFGGLPMNEAMPKAKQAAADALELDNSIAEAHASLANVSAWYEWDPSTAEIEFKKAIELNPNYPTAHHWYGLYLAAMKRHDESIREIRAAQALDPASLIINADLGYAFYLARQYEQAIDQFKRTLEMDPNFEIGHYETGLALVEKKAYDEAITEFEKARALDDKPQDLAMIGYAYAKAGKRNEAERVLRELQKLANQRFVAPNEMVIIYTGLGDRDRAFEWLEKDYQAHTSNIFEINADPRMDGLRSDPRFLDLLQRTGLTDVPARGQ